jgi:hypothetical protein
MWINLEAIKAREARVKASAERVARIFNAKSYLVTKAELGKMPQPATRGTLHRLCPRYGRRTRPLTATQFYNLA